VAEKPDGSANQLWCFEKAGKPYHIKCKETGRVLDASNNSADDGKAVITWDLKNPPSPNQLWMLIDAKKK